MDSTVQVTPFTETTLWYQCSLNTSFAAASLPHKACCFWLMENLGLNGLQSWISVKN